MFQNKIKNYLINITIIYHKAFYNYVSLITKLQYNINKNIIV